MNKEVRSIARNLQNVLSGEPWYGRPVYDLLDEVDPSIASKRPNADSHSLTELIYHMVTWAEFVLRRLEGDKERDMAAFEKLDWREIEPQVHSWEKGVAEYKRIHGQILSLLESKDDQFLSEKVDYREYNFRFLLNGLVHHNIYHIGQVAYMKKLLG